MFFGLFSPQPPLAVREKAWTEVRMRWLARQFGIDRLLKAEVVLPDDHWFPEDYQGTADDARRLLDCIAGVMLVAPSSIQLEFCEDAACGAGGQCQPGLIGLTECQLTDPLGLVALLSRELGLGLLAGRGLLQDALDAQWVTELLPVFLGLGVFAANAALHEETKCHGRHGHSAGRRGRLSPCMIGYALALFAWVRNERSPEWGRLLHPHAADMLAAGLRYLHATEDSLFNPETSCSADWPTSWNALCEQILGGSPSACVGGLWELAERPRDSREDLGCAAVLVGKLLSNRVSAVRAEAARALATLGPAAEPVLDDLIQLLEDEKDDVSAAAAYALGRLGMQPEKVLPNLVLALDERPLVRRAAAAIAAYGCAARPVVPKLTTALLRALAATEYGDVDCLVHAIEATAADPTAELHQVLADCDAELQPQAEQILADRRPVPGGAGAPGAWFGEGYQ